MKVYGCQMNVYDSDRVRTAMTRRGWKEVPEDEADVVVFTGCSVRGRPNRRYGANLADTPRVGEKTSALLSR
jgi:tRNA-2-methylthio-N6-dimethylallyladenosine synthase